MPTKHQARGMRSACGFDDSGGRWVAVRAERRRGRILCRQMALSNGVPEQGAEVRVAALPAAAGFTRWIEAPFASRRKASRVLGTLLDILLPFPLEACVYRFVNVRRTSTGRIQALGVGGLSSSVEERLATCRDAGIDPEILDAEGLALWGQALDESDVPDDPEMATLLVYASGERVTLVIGRGRSFINAHALRTASVGELGRLLKAALGDWGGSYRWIWGGAGLAANAGIQSFRTAAESRWEGESLTVDDPETYLARALASGVVRNEATERNLRHGLLSHPGWTLRESRRAMRLPVAAALTGLLLALVSLTALVTDRASMMTLSNEFAHRVEALTGGTAGGATGSDALLIAARVVDAKVAATGPFKDYIGPRLMRDLTLLLERSDAMGLRIFQLSIDAQGVALRGAAPGWRHGEQFQAALESRWPGCRLERGDAGSDGWIPFTLKAGKQGT